MNDVEQAFRDALRRADTVEVPVPPIDPAEFTGQGRRLPPRWGSALVAAAWLVVLAGVCVAMWMSAGRGIPAVPVPPAGQAATTVEVDIYSGRENPVVELDQNVADELYAVFDERAGSLQPADPPEPTLGFRGFVVTPAEADRPVLRVQTGAVFVEGVDDHQRLLDPDRVFYRLVLDGIRDSLPEDVLKAIDDPGLVLPEPSVSAEPSDGPDPDRTGDTATWVLLESDTVTPESTDIVIGVTRLGCASGETGKVLPAVIEYGEDRIVIRVDVEAWNDQPANCQGNEEVLFSVHLAEPIGQRQLVDAACLTGEAQGTSFCAGGAVRWTP